MKVAFLTEMGFEGKIPSNHPNMRTEFAWMFALSADHYCIHHTEAVRDYDHVFVIFPKGKVFLSAEGSKIVEGLNPVSTLLQNRFIDRLKEVNKRVHCVQEGPHWWFNDYELVDQIGYYNMLASCDTIFAHNQSDKKYYQGMFPDKPVHCMATQMVDTLVKDIVPQTEDKVIIGGNFARWYGGFESYIIAQEFGVPIWGQTSHATRDGEDQLINQLPRVLWSDWMKQLSCFKYAVHLMPTVAAGTFSLNCAYFGIPCIGNIAVDTQLICHPDLSVEVSDVARARKLAKQLTQDKDFYQVSSQKAKQNYQTFYNQKLFKQIVLSILEK